VNMVSFHCPCCSLVPALVPAECANLLGGSAVPTFVFVLCDRFLHCQTQVQPPLNYSICLFSWFIMVFHPSFLFICSHACNPGCR